MLMETPSVDGAVPAVGRIDSQLPPVALAVQFIVPVPSFTIGAVCGSGFAPPAWALNSIPRDPTDNTGFDESTSKNT